jgi:hypothetical protein
VSVSRLRRYSLGNITALPEAKQAAALAELVGWTNPGPGGFYDDMGELDAMPHYVYNVTSDTGDQAFYPTTIVVVSPPSEQYYQPVQRGTTNAPPSMDPGTRPVIPLHAPVHVTPPPLSPLILGFAGLPVAHGWYQPHMVGTSRTWLVPAAHGWYQPHMIGTSRTWLVPAAHGWYQPHMVGTSRTWLVPAAHGWSGPMIATCIRIR